MSQVRRRSVEHNKISIEVVVLACSNTPLLLTVYSGSICEV